MPGSIQGAGLGLRSPHVAQILRDKPDVPWFEILADNYLAAGGPIPQQLETVRQDYPMTFHCVGMSLGGTHPLDEQYLARLKRLMDRIQPSWVSDHLCFTRQASHNFHDLLPLPYNTETLNHLISRIQQVQEYLGEAILVENVSSYLEFEASAIEEAEFVAELVTKAGCHLLLDINNVYVNAQNHGFDPCVYLRAMPHDVVKEIHLAGYETREGYLLDAHNQRVTSPVWDLYESYIQDHPEVPTLIEWDKDIPAFEVLQEEADKAERMLNHYQTHKRKIA